MLSIKAVVVSSGGLALPWARLSKGLVVGDVGCKSSKFVVWQLFDNWHELGHVVRPSEPAPVASIKVHSSTWGLGSDGLDCVLDTFLVGSLRVGAVCVAQICGEVREGVRLNNECNVNFTFVLAEDICVNINVLGLVFLKARGAVTALIVVAGSIVVVAAADLSI